ncbi:Protein of unknown function [Streptosporangium subroseum]|uniref:DUF4240 domain-containing protein n=1 Tax=Streptosporangium subroseum TaxID=106412 RepID=A0A239I4L7_9ACTN|nr:DUF4240 domain-containing protein [Streptosporangium subroseum]SNS87264.1 Protein of unknown function [Streptosporangium subroseum]
MDADAFWEMIERSDRETGARQERLAWLDAELSLRSAEEIADFSMWWISATSRLCAWDLYAVYCSVLGWGSLDGFEYFANWLVSLGRTAFEQVAAIPDSVIELPQLLRLLELRRVRLANDEFPVWSMEEEPEFELLGYVAFDPYVKVAGLDVVHLGDAVRARGVQGKFPLMGADFDGEGWDFSDETEMNRRLPRLARYRAIR